MTVRELRSILDEWHPDEEVCVFTSSHRHLQLVGFNQEMSTTDKCCVIDGDWAIADKPIESEKDKLIRQRATLNEQIAKFNYEERRALEKKVKKGKKKAKKNRTTAEQVLAGYVPTGKRGRPRKIRPDDVLPEILPSTKEKPQ